MNRTCVYDVMDHQQHSIEPTATLRDAATMMQVHEFGELAVLEDGALKGIVTDRDIVVSGLAEGLQPDEAKVADIMTTHVFTCDENDTLEDAADLMGDQDVQRLVVFNEKGQVSGMLAVEQMIKRPDRDAVNDDVLHHLYKYA